MFVVYREGYEIFGVGKTPEEAKQDAMEWLDDGGEEIEKAQIVEQNGACLGQLYVGKCTERLAAALQQDSAELVFDWNKEGMLDIVEGEDVEK